MSTSTPRSFRELPLSAPLHAALDDFRGGRCRVLIVTDVAARAIDVTGTGRVIKHDLPQAVEDYAHRIGRARVARCTSRRPATALVTYARRRRGSRPHT